MTRRRLWRPLSLAALALAALTGCDLGAEEIQQDVEQGAEDVQQGAEEGIAEVEQGLEDVQDAGGEDEGGQDG